MKKIAILLVLFFPALLPAKQRTIAYYDLDSVIQLVPEFGRISDSLNTVTIYLNEQRMSMMTEYEYKRNAFARDSSQMSALIRSLKSAELTRYDIQLEDFDVQMNNEKDKIWNCYKNRILEPLNRIIAEITSSGEFAAVVATGAPYFISGDYARKCITNILAGKLLLLNSRAQT